MDRILLGQLGANGDCLYATILARQLRKDFPDAHITWAISSQCAGLLRNNPHINEIWEVPIPRWDLHDSMWRLFEREATRRLVRHEFDHAYFSQIWPNNFQNFDGTIRPSILRSYERPITVPIENIIHLTDEEKHRADRYVSEAGVSSFEHRILFECTSKSGQSHMTIDLAQEIAQHIYAALPSTTVILSTNLPVQLAHPNSRYVGHLSLRECAHLSRHCSLFIGAGSGGTVAATSTAAHRIPIIQVLAESTSVFASFKHDFEHFGLDATHMLETTEESAKRIAKIVVVACRDGIGVACSRFERRIKVRFQHYLNMIEMCLMKQYHFLDAAQSLATTAQRYGWQTDLVNFASRRIAPHLSADPAWLFASRRREGELFRAQLDVAQRQPVNRTPALNVNRQG